MKMVKKEHKVYLENKHYRSLIDKARTYGFKSKNGILTDFVKLIAENKIIIVDDNVLRFIRPSDKIKIL